MEIPGSAFLPTSQTSTLSCPADCHPFTHVSCAIPVLLFIFSPTSRAALSSGLALWDAWGTASTPTHKVNLC